MSIPGQNAARWLQRLHGEIDTLERFLERCSHARGCEQFEEKLRQLVYRSHHLAFSADKPNSTVFVLSARHRKRRAVGEREGTGEE